MLKYLCPYLINEGIWLCAEGQRPGITAETLKMGAQGAM